MGRPGLARYGPGMNRLDFWTDQDPGMDQDNFFGFSNVERKNVLDIKYDYSNINVNEIFRRVSPRHE